MRTFLPVLAGTLAIVACSTPPSEIDAPATASTPVGIDDDGVASDASPPLLGTTWALVEIQSMDDSVYTPGAPDRFTLRMLEGGALEARVHCNRGRGTWESEGRSQLRFGPMALTRAHCGPGSLHDRFVNQLPYVRSYVFRDGRLYLATMADGAILEFRPLEEVARSGSPAFDCDAARGSVERTICADPELAALDRELDALYQKALTSYPPEEVATLRATQRGWISGRNDCWKSDDPTDCARREYEIRITELQIGTAATLVPSVTVYRCEDGSEVSVYFYPDTRLPSAVLNRASDQVIAYRSPAASGARYEGRNVVFWTRGEHAMLTWLGAETSCRRQTS